MTRSRCSTSPSWWPRAFRTCRSTVWCAKKTSSGRQQNHATPGGMLAAMRGSFRVATWMVAGVFVLSVLAGLGLGACGANDDTNEGTRAACAEGGVLTDCPDAERTA